MRTRFLITLSVEVDNESENPVSTDEMQDFICETGVSIRDAGRLSVSSVEISSYKRKTA